MQLVNIKSRSKLPITVQLSPQEIGMTPTLPALDVNRSIATRDKVSNETRTKEVVVRCPPAIRFPAGGELKGLPASVLKHPVIKGLLARTPGRRPKLVVTAQYTPAPVAKKTKPKAAAAKPTPAKAAPVVDPVVESAPASSTSTPSRGRGRSKSKSAE